MNANVSSRPLWIRQLGPFATSNLMSLLPWENLPKKFTHVSAVTFSLICDEAAGLSVDLESLGRPSSRDLVLIYSWLTHLIVLEMSSVFLV